MIPYFDFFKKSDFVFFLFILIWILIWFLICILILKGPALLPLAQVRSKEALCKASLVKG